MTTLELADELQRLCCAETESKFFDCVTDNIGTIISALRLSASPAGNGDDLADRVQYVKVTALEFGDYDQANLIQDIQDALRRPALTTAVAPDGAREALEKIANGSFPGASDLAISGDWHPFVERLQEIARAALARHHHQPVEDKRAAILGPYLP